MKFELFKIGETALHSVSSIEISKAARNRTVTTNLNGDMLIDQSAIKRTISINIVLCSAADMAVIEAAVTSSIGGIIGIILGSVATSAVGAVAGLNATPTPAAVIVSFSVSVGIGLLFGYMPASRAAKLNPIDALRSE